MSLHRDALVRRLVSAVRDLDPSARDAALARPASLHSPCLTPLGKGVLLVARPSLSDTSFARTVVLILHHERAGALGLVINKPVALDLAELIPEAGLPEDHGIPVHYGGPVMPASAEPSSVHALTVLMPHVQALPTASAQSPVPPSWKAPEPLL